MLQSNQKIIRHKVGLLNLAEELGNVSKACQMMGLSRDTFYRYRDAVEEGGVEALLEKPRRGPNLKNRVDEETENAVVDYAVEYRHDKPVGVAWVDALRASVRPIITYAFFLLFASVKGSALYVLIAVEGLLLAEALPRIWDPETQALFAAVWVCQ